MKPSIGLFCLVASFLSNAWADVTPTRDHPWSASGSVSLGASYEYNPLLSSVAPVEGEALKGNLEGMVWRQLGKETEVTAILSGERTRYLGTLNFLDDSQFWLAEAQVKTWTARRVVVKARIRALWDEEVMDFSDTEVLRVVLPVRVATGSAALGATWKLTPRLSLEGEGEGSKAIFKGYRGDYREGKGRLRLVYKADKVEAEVGAEYARRPYRFRTEYNLSGRPLPGALLTTQRTRAFGSIAVQPLWTRGVKAKAGVALKRVDDGASGFFTTGTGGVWLSLDRDGLVWNWDVRLSWDRERYAHQTVGTGIHPELRASTNQELKGRIERVLTPRWSANIEASIQKMDANSAEYAYKTVTVSGALERRF